MLNKVFTDTAHQYSCVTDGLRSKTDLAKLRSIQVTHKQLILPSGYSHEENRVPQYGEERNETKKVPNILWIIYSRNPDRTSRNI